MARPRKEGLDYFPHDTDALSDEKVEALRALYGNDGYAFYFILLERIYRTPNGELNVSDAETRQILASKVAVTLQKFEQMLQTALNRDIFDRQAYEKGVLTSDGIRKRRAPVLAKRQTMRDIYSQKVSDAETIPETPQSKAKESIVKKRAIDKQPTRFNKQDEPAESVAKPLPAGPKGPGKNGSGPAINDKTISAVATNLQSHLHKLGYWDGKHLCKKRLNKFVSDLVTEAEKKANPAGWLVTVAPKRLNERLEDFKPGRQEMDET